ncbi:hypothetical protein L486_05744 [Kwoniella mangroviensis CBS 10435]|uniref:Major facilitator superfamily (MFS) profile domain-containing protein n=1 Tax=Kwoniella mangroviensis CBS 10435 TaxID=1331196 RepID=A0A1B9IMT5_9TREE|nr:uncharacterized protein I203_07392 [Kwoniella mangroviensis CBS 8507]OCF56889.1 hypothetical protein L486_05744 [Kwoniella mangroviensis CBS 10435]OCF63694.1 hypothetical protein I203_07392 [Kwoniella mangroviensis CBS 8507]
MPSQPKKDASYSVDRLLPYVFLCTIGPSVVAASNLFVVKYVMCRYYWTSRGADSIPDPGDERCANRDVQALAGSVLAALATLDGIFSFLSSPYVQSLSDRYGRRPLLIIGPLIATISTGSILLAYYINNSTIAWILLILTGIFVSASTKAVFLPSLCVADVATDDARTRFYSRMEAVALLGPGTAYIISALVSRYVPNIAVPYFIALGAQIGASLWSFFFIAETRKFPSNNDNSSDDEEEEEEGRGVVAEITENLEAPVKPLKLIWPHRHKGKLHWELFVVALSLFMTTSGTVFIATASLLFLSDKFNFNPENNAWMLAFLTFSRFAYLIVLFPFILKFGRAGYNRYLLWKEKKKQADGERQPLVRRDTSAKQEDANYFDVILAFFSVIVDAVALGFVSLSLSYQQVLAAFAIMAFGAGDNPTFKAVFVSYAPPEHSSEALAALDMVFSAAKLASPPLLGSLYAAFVEVGKPQFLFLTAGGLCAMGALLISPLIFAKRKFKPTE